METVGIILTYKHASFLEETYRRIPGGILDKIIVVDDSSDDGTKDLARKLSLPFYSTPKNLGYGGNIEYALTIAAKLGAKYMVEIHGDGQYDPKYIPKALHKIKRKGCDFLLGSRFKSLTQPLKDHMPLSRYLANIGLNLIARLVLQIPLTEFHSGFRIYTRRLIETIGFEGTSNTNIYSFENIAQAAYHKLSICEIAIRCDYAKEHTSLSLKRSIVYSFQMLWVLVLYLLAKFGLKSRLFAPGLK